MVVLDGIKEGIGKKIRGKLGAPSAYGTRNYGAFAYGAGADTFGIYRVRHRWGKFVQEKMVFYFPINPKTGPQLIQQQKMTDAVTAWQDLTPSQKEEYNIKAKGKDMSGYNLFLSEYLLSL